MEQKVFRRLGGLLVGVLLTLAAPDVLAQSNDPAEKAAEKNPAKQPFHEVIDVTASKRGKQDILDVPQSVEAFSGPDLEFREVNNPVQALDLIPGASAGVTGGAGTQRYNFRGTGAMGSAGDLALGFYIDDVAYYLPGNPFGPPIRFFDLEALEVLRGPQGTLYGQGAMGGTMIIRTAQPDLDEVRARGRVIGSNMKDGGFGWKTDVTVSVPLIQDKLALRVTAGREKRSGLAESPDFPGRSNIDDGGAWDYRLKLLYKPADKLSLRATFWQSNDRGYFSPVYASVDPPTITGTGGINGLTRNRTSLSSLVVDWDTPAGIFRSGSSYTRYNDLYFAGSAFDALINGSLVPFLLKINAAQLSRSFNEEVTLRTPRPGQDWIVGANYIDGNGTQDVTAQITSPPGIPTSASRSLTKTVQGSVFGEISRDFMGGLITPLVGLRLYRDRREFTDRGTAVFQTSDVFNTVSPRFNLRVRPSRNTELYLNMAKGFRSGTFNTQSNVDIAALFGLSTAVSIPAATLWSYEAGANLRFPNANLLVQPAVYHNDFSNYPIQAQIANAGVVVPVKKVTANGVDLLALYNTPINGLGLSLTGNYNKTQPNNPDPAVVKQVPALADGKQLPYVPRWALNVAATYQRPLTNALNGFAYASMTRRGGQIDFITSKTSPNTDDLTLRLGVRNSSDRWSLSLFGKNLTDDVGPAVTSGGLQIRYDRRTIGVEIDTRLR